ncbi:hypothetical protein C8F04DRAFT_1278064 [Mycena alexandri]|uniref:Uncharacterized protein n=1 Tax=Mycena alexandri TaxID=1745969 RepID=A0AAD6WMM7_9AGAR|nr:hypothetical protein C8F04DRAFT_1278064 [Mycena alexandri]
MRAARRKVGEGESVDEGARCDSPRMTRSAVAPPVACTARNDGDGRGNNAAAPVGTARWKWARGSGVMAGRSGYIIRDANPRYESGSSPQGAAVRVVVAGDAGEGVRDGGGVSTQRLASARSEDTTGGTGGAVLPYLEMTGHEEEERYSSFGAGNAEGGRGASDEWATPTPKFLRLCSDSGGKGPRVVIHFNHMKKLPPPKRVYAGLIHAEISEALTDIFKEDRFAPLLKAVKWSQTGNLYLYPDAAYCTPAFLAEQDVRIWPVLRPLLGLAEGHKRPTFAVELQRHSVVFHGVPMPPNPTAVFTRSAVRTWALPEGSKGSLVEYALLCRPEDLPKKSSVALRVSFSEEEDALELITKGGTMLGSPCRVTRYLSRSRTN